MILVLMHLGFSTGTIFHGKTNKAQNFNEEIFRGDSYITDQCESHTHCAALSSLVQFPLQYYFIVSLQTLFHCFPKSRS